MTDAVNGLAAGLRKFLGPASRTLYRLSATALCIMPVPVFLDVLSRLIYSGSIPGVIEIEEMLLAIIVFFGVAYTQYSDGHIKIDLFTAKMSEGTRAVLDTGIYLASTFIFVVMSWQLVEVGLKKYANNELSFTLELPIYPFRFLAALGAAVLALVTLLHFLNALAEALEKKKGNWAALSIAVVVLGLGSMIVGNIPEDLEGASAGLAGMVLLFTLLFLGMPIGFGMALTGLIGMVVIHGSMPPALNMVGIGSYETAASYMLTVVPLFILMGEFAYHSGISTDLFETARVWLGRLPGGMGMSAVSGCAGFSAVCGDSLATAVTMGTCALPGMKEAKCDMVLSTGCLAAGGTLGILIPPSVGFIFYAIVTEESIGRLFVAGMVPGLLLAALFMGIIYLKARINPALAPPGPKTTWTEKLISLKGVVGMLAIFILILGGILGGIFSPVEGGAVGAVGAFIYAVIKRRMSWEILKASLFDTLVITCKLMMILIGVGILGYFLAATRLPFELAEFITDWEVNRYVILAGVIGLFILLGCVLNVIPMILLVLPTIFPTITALGFDPIWFGVICVLTMEMGQITPPIGVNVFAIGSVCQEVPVQDIFKGIVPFFICMLVCVGILVLIPDLALFLPNLILGE